MTPTEQEIEFFKKATRIQELWERKRGDLVWVDNRIGLILTVYETVAIVDIAILGCTGYPKGDLAWFPRQGQLQAMLEERGYRWDVGKLPNSYTATIWNDDIDLECEGPTPSIALGKCLLEVLKEEE